MDKQYASLFEGLDLSGYNPDQIMNTKKVYDYIVESVEIAKEEGVSPDEVMDEGIFAGLLAASAGAMVGPAIGKAMCKCLGIQENGVLGNLLTSRLVIAAICGELGLNY